MIRELPIELIDARTDARPLVESTVGGLVDSIGAVGLINPIRVRASGDRWEVIAGHHRLTACKRLGLAEITAFVVVEDDLHAELAMIDENLCRAELSPADRAQQTARRKAIYLELHPDTAQHVAGGKARQETAGDNLSFAEETAAATGKDKRTVQRDAERGEKVIDEVMNLIRGTKLDSGSYLDKIKNLSPNDQIAAAKRDLAASRRQARPKPKPKQANAPLSPEMVIERQVAALMNAWNAAGPEARQEFLESIDTPVFDRAADRRPNFSQPSPSTEAA